MPEAEPTVSVIIPVYNSEAYLRECLDSVVSQDFDALEVVMVDDGSTDSSAAICREYAAADSRLRIISQPNAGLSVSRNVGIAAARGRWLAFVDSDDILAPHAIKNLYEAAVGSGRRVAVGGMTVWRDGTPLPPAKVATARPRVIPTGPEVAAAILYQTHNAEGLNSSSSGKLFHRSLFAGHPYTPGLIYEDLDLIPVVTAQADGAVLIADTTYYYRMRRGSLLDSFDKRRLDVLDVVEGLVERFKDDATLRRAAHDRLMSAACNMLMLMARHRYVDAAAAERCAAIIRRRRWYTLFDRRVRLRNRLGALLAILAGPRIFASRFLANKALTR